MFYLIGIAQFFQFAHLRVDQRVHRIDDQRVHPFLFLRSVHLQQVVKDRGHIGERLARAGAGDDHEMLAVQA